MFDATDLEIMRLLQENSKYSNKEIGEKIHLTGQMVGVRINRLVENDLIHRFTVDVNHKKLGTNISFVKVYKDSAEIDIDKIIEDNLVEECYEIINENSYLLKIAYNDKNLFDDLIERISTCSMYQISHTDKRVK